MSWLSRLTGKSRLKKHAPSKKVQSHEGVTLSMEELIRLRFHAAGLSMENRKKVLTMMSGGFHSGFRGRGVDFVETRHYQPGDDIRTIDWRVTARTGHPHTKLFCEERERPVYILVDYTPQMFFGTRVAFKSVVAARAAAILAWAAASNGDRVGGIIFTAGKNINIKPAGGSHGVLRLLKELSDEDNQVIESVPGMGLQHALYQLRSVVRPGSMICILSDFYHLDEDSEKHLKRLAIHNDIFSLFIYDTLEMRLPPPGRYTVSDGEQNMSFYSGDKKLRNDYKQQFRQRYEHVESVFTQRGLRVMPLATHESIPDKIRLGLAGLRDSRAVSLFS